MKFYPNVFFYKSKSQNKHENCTEDSWIIYSRNQFILEKQKVKFINFDLFHKAIKNIHIPDVIYSSDIYMSNYLR